MDLGALSSYIYLGWCKGNLLEELNVNTVTDESCIKFLCVVSEMLIHKVTNFTTCTNSKFEASRSEVPSSQRWAMHVSMISIPIFFTLKMAELQFHILKGYGKFKVPMALIHIKQAWGVSARSEAKHKTVELYDKVVCIPESGNRFFGRQRNWLLVKTSVTS